MFVADRNDPQALAIQKEREERVRRIREQQEEERKKKLEELRQHVSFHINHCPHKVFLGVEGAVGGVKTPKNCLNHQKVTKIPTKPSKKTPSVRP